MTDSSLHRSVETLARAGYAARGVVYLFVGGLAARSALGSGRGTPGASDALRGLAGQPLGRLALGFFVLGLLAYAAWRFVQASIDPDGPRRRGARVAARLGSAVIGAVYVGLAVAAASAFAGLAATDSETATRDWTAFLLARPYGRGLVALASAAVFWVAGVQARIAWTCSFQRDMPMASLSSGERDWVRRIGRFGVSARALVFALSGAFLLRAAAWSDPAQARGLGGALDAIEDGAYGPALLAAVAAGLVAFGFFSILKARYRWIPPVEPALRDALL
jgi:hypothetical protein